jgi:putative MATE family efflux protein
MHFQLLVDRAFLGNVDSRYLSAIGNVMIPYGALSFFFFSAATGLTVLLAQSIGRRDHDHAAKIGQASFFYSTIFSSMLFFLWFFGAAPIFSLFGAKDQILLDAVTFVRIISVSLIFLGLEVSMSSILQAAGQTRLIMITGILKSLLNVGLDWVLVFGHLGSPAFGLEGAAYATMISNILGALFIVAAVLAKKSLPFHLSKREMMKPEWQLYWRTLRIGLPSGFESLLWFAGQLVLMRLLNTLDPMAIGIYSLVSGIQAIALTIYRGFANASLTMVGQYWGDAKYEEARGIGLYCQKLATVVSVTIGIGLLLFPHFLAQLFSHDQAIIERSVPILRLSAAFILCQVVNVVTGQSIRATGDTKWMLYSQIFGTAFVVGMSSFMIFGLSLGLVGMYIVMIIDEFVRGIINFTRFYTGHNPLRHFVPGLSAKKIKTYGDTLK